MLTTYEPIFKMQKIDINCPTIRSISEYVQSYKLPNLAQSIARITHRKNDANKIKLAELKRDISRHVSSLKLGQEGKRIVISDDISLKEARFIEKELGRLNQIEKLETEHELRAERYMQDTAYLSKVGARQQTTTGLNITGNIDASGAKVLSKTFGIESGKRFDNNDEGSVRINSVRRVMARLWTGLSFKISEHFELGAGAQTQLSTTQTKYKKFTNHKELGQYLAQKSSSKLTQQKQKALNAKTTIAPVLSEHVASISDKKFDQMYQSMRPEQSKTYKHGIKNRQTSAAEVSATAKFSVSPRYTLGAQAALQTSKSKEKTVETVYEDLTQYIKNPEDMISLAPFLNAFVPSIDKPKEWIAFSEQLEKDIIEYSETVKKHDHIKSANQWNASHECNKHRLEDKYGNIGRHQQLQFFYLCHAWLNASAKELSPSANQAENGFTNMADRIHQTLKNIDFKYSVTRLNHLTKVRQHVMESKKDVNQTATVQVGPITLTIHERERHFIHPSRVRCGEYRDVNITLSAHTNLTELLQLPKLQKQLSEALVSNQLDSIINVGTLLQLDLTGLVTIQKRWFKPDAKQLVFNGQEQRQFTRYYTGSDIVTSTTGSIQTGSGFSLDANLRYQQRQQQVVGEDIDSNDLIYSLVRFNKLYKDAGKDLSSQENPWAQFIQSHKSSYQEMFFKLADPESALHHQAQTLLKEAQKEARALITEAEFFEQMQAYRKAIEASEDNNSAESFANALLVFNQLLISQFVKTEKLHKETWAKKPFKAERSKALSNKSKIAKALHLQRKVPKNKQTNSSH
ncbi:hypothetical protein [Vibrio pectenicida]|uniref:Uncharacterized protein n=1 Tax=Vibrio pectenicida TaxID=62763 RepID=A0A3R9F650_9VIBR|nr:hypothetical protein [Vibrio pectenicida]RSD29856.1 hypothetical protein EJA03_16930 [Vibrio pectenicida]